MKKYIEIIKSYESDYGFKPDWRHVLKELLDEVQKDKKGSYKDVEDFIKELALQGTHE